MLLSQLFYGCGHEENNHRKKVTFCVVIIALINGPIQQDLVIVDLNNSLLARGHVW